MAGKEWEVDDTQMEDESYDDGASATVTEGEDNGDDAEETIVGDNELGRAAGFVGNHHPAVHMKEKEEEGDLPDSKEVPVAASCGAVEGGSGWDNYDGENEPTQPTQIDSPPAATATATAQDRQDSENTESPHPPSSKENPVEQVNANETASQLDSPTATGAVERRRTPSPPRRTGRGSGVFLSRDGAVASGDGGTGSGFLSSAEPASKAAKARATASFLSSPHPLPRGWLDDQLNAAGAAVTDGAKAEPQKLQRVQQQQQQPSARKPRKTANGGTAMVAEALPQRKLLNKVVVAGPGGWIRTKCSPSKGGNAPLPAAAAAASAAGGGVDEYAPTLGAQQRSISQSILAIGVPHERRVVEPPQSRPTRAAVPVAGDHSDSDQEEDEDEDGENPVGGVVGGTVNSQELRAKEFSQIRKGCSQEKDEFERMMDAAIAGAAEGTETDVQSGALGRGSSQQSEHKSQDVDGGCGSRESGRGGGDGIHVKRKKMRASAQAAAGGGAEETPRGGGVGRKGATISRTPGAYIGGAGTKSTIKKRAVPR